MAHQEQDTYCHHAAAEHRICRETSQPGKSGRTICRVLEDDVTHRLFKTRSSPESEPDRIPATATPSDIYLKSGIEFVK